MILFLDYDGVLHQDAVYRERGRPVLRDQGELFMWSGLLLDALASRPEVRGFGFSRARRYLPVALRSRVIGATWRYGARRRDQTKLVGSSHSLSADQALC